jgi:hypothetical protein
MHCAVTGKLEQRQHQGLIVRYRHRFLALRTYGLSSN